MRLFRIARWLLPALLFSLIPASSHAQLAISVNLLRPSCRCMSNPCARSPT
jgi:hypothetical protein